MKRKFSPAFNKIFNNSSDNFDYLYSKFNGNGNNIAKAKTLSTELKLLIK